MTTSSSELFCCTSASICSIYGTNTHASATLGDRHYRGISLENIIRTQLAVLYREVSLFQRQISTQLCVIGTADSVLIREMPLIQSVLSREIPLYCTSLCMSQPPTPTHCALTSLACAYLPLDLAGQFPSLSTCTHEPPAHVSTCTHVRLQFVQTSQHTAQHGALHITHSWVDSSAQVCLQLKLMHLSSISTNVSG